MLFNVMDLDWNLKPNLVLLFFILDQGCGYCKNKYCTNCKTNYCNEENLSYKNCFTNTKNLCFAKFNEACFEERMQNNGG